MGDWVAWLLSPSVDDSLLGEAVRWSLLWVLMMIVGLAATVGLREDERGPVQWWVAQRRGRSSRRAADSLTPASERTIDPVVWVRPDGPYPPSEYPDQSE